MENSQINYQEKELLVRLIAMRVLPPMDIEAVNREQLDDLLIGLPAIHVGRITFKNDESAENPASKQSEFYDITPSGLSEQVLGCYKWEEIPENYNIRIEYGYSPEEWNNYFKNNQIDPQKVINVFRAWGVGLKYGQVNKAINNNYAENYNTAVKVQKELQLDLLARLSAAGLVDSVDLDNFSMQKAAHVINGLPSLTEATLIFETNRGVRKEKFINVDEFYVKEVYMGVADEYNSSLQAEDALNDNFEDREPESRKWMEHQFEEKFPIDEKLEVWNWEKTKKVIKTGTSTLDKQIREFFNQNPELEDKLVHKVIETKGGLAWLDFFKQDIKFADAGNIDKDGKHTFSSLKRAFKNWEFDIKNIKPENAFRDNLEANINEGQLRFYGKLIQTVVNAGITPRMPLGDWKNLNYDKAHNFAAQIPLLPTHDGPGDWLKLFSGKKPNDLELNDLQGQFMSSGIPFNEALIKAAFKIPPPTKTRKGDSKMPKLDLNDYRKMMSRLVQKGAPRMGSEEYKKLNLDGAQEYVRTYDETPSDKQKMVLDTIKHENKDIDPENDFKNYSKMEATALIDKMPERQVSYEAPENPATEDTRKTLRKLMDLGYTPRMPHAVWKNLSEEEGQGKIQNAYTRMPISESKVELIMEELKGGKIDTAFLAQFIKSPNFGKKEIGELKMNQANQLLDSRDASEKQKDLLQQFMDEKHIEPFDMTGLKMGEATKLIDATKAKPRDPDGPAAGFQKNILMALSNEEKIAPVTPEELNSMTYAQAEEKIDKSPIQGWQKQRLIKAMDAGQMEQVPEVVFANMTRGEANTAIAVLDGKLPKEEMPGFKERDYPAMDYQIKQMDDLKESGRIKDYPQNITFKEAEKLIRDTIANDPIGSHQVSILEKKVAQGLIPPMTDEDKAKCTIGNFRSLLELAKKNETKLSPEKSASKAPEKSPTQEKNAKKRPAGISR